MYVCDVRVVLLEHGGGRLGIFKLPVCIYNQSYYMDHYCSLQIIASINSFLLERAQRAANSARGAKRIVMLTNKKKRAACAPRSFWLAKMNIDPTRLSNSQLTADDVLRMILKKDNRTSSK